MGHQYAGANAFPTDFTVPDDLDDDKATTFNVALEALGDRAVYLQQHTARLTTQEFLTPGTTNWTAPPRVTKVRARGVGGGGSGGGGRTDFGASGNGGGSGGGAAKQGVAEVTVVPGNVYVVTIAAGGASPAVDVAGHDGADSSFAGVTFYGAGGGGAATAPAGAAYEIGGPAIRNGVPFAAQAVIGLPPSEGQGGWAVTGTGSTTTAFRTGGHSPVGRGAAPGADNGGLTGAWGGAGGAASGYAGSTAGGGGAAATASPAVAGGVGAAGTKGGGGGGGGGDLSGGIGAGAGGAGGAGAITLSWSQESP